MKQDIENMTGYFGEYGGRYVDEALIPVLKEIEDFFKKSMKDQEFLNELESIQKSFIGRPTPLLYAENATEALGGAKIYLKLECLANTGAHKINNAIGQALLAKKMGRTRIIAETGAGQHGVATACICARLGLDCEIYMGQTDIERQRPNVFWMEMFGAKVVPVTCGTKTLTDAVDEAFRVWVTRTEDTYYLIGSALGPAPYPDMVREFQSVIGKEVKSQFKQIGKELPDVMIACVGGGSNSIGFFSEFLEEESVQLIGVEAGGTGSSVGEHAVRMTTDQSSVNCIQGYKSKFLQENGELLPTHSISAGLDYAGIGPQLAYLGEKGRITFSSAKDTEVIEAVKFFAKHEGIIPALESSHALAEAIKIAPTLDQSKSIVVNVSGRGDKDIFITSKAIDEGKWFNFLEEELERHKLGQ
ncbi:tryptophan synthase subunit beta [Anaeromicropila populeti]|uniref:Tryptophan synthase beta chain n=1 Tax=Anaeromicropila populeti TaxID=37658 RepID=A0A1I6K993_9FIRM|nr:tryptophan synthase subunit beta [Anaeromicropila populeti]SFR87801.1 tryptophan synthase beta chain [Anaeromicropila populeti]